MPGSIPPTSQLDWLSSTTAMIVLFWSRATRDLLKSFGWGIAALHRLHPATKLPSLRRAPHRICLYRGTKSRGFLEHRRHSRLIPLPNNRDLVLLKLVRTPDVAEMGDVGSAV